jgi:hypothetical protein
MVKIYFHIRRQRSKRLAEEREEFEKGNAGQYTEK